MSISRIQIDFLGLHVLQTIWLYSIHLVIFLIPLFVWIPSQSQTNVAIPPGDRNRSMQRNDCKQVRGLHHWFPKTDDLLAADTQKNKENCACSKWFVSVIGGYLVAQLHDRQITLNFIMPRRILSLSAVLVREDDKRKWMSNIYNLLPTNTYFFVFFLHFAISAAVSPHMTSWGVLSLFWNAHIMGIKDT